MADESGCRKHSANITAAERELLVDLVSQSSVVECKRTDGLTMREKDAAWLTVAEQFNAVSTVKRDHWQLKQVIISISDRETCMHSCCVIYIFLIYWLKT